MVCRSAGRSTSAPALPPGPTRGGGHTRSFHPPPLQPRRPAMTADRYLPRRTACIAGALALSSGLLAAAAPSAVGQAMVVVPPGCGSLSGTLVPAGQLDDHSARSEERRVGKECRS